MERGHRVRTPAMFSDPIPLLPMNNADATVTFWRSLTGSVTTGPRDLIVHWYEAQIQYQAVSRPTPPTITYGVGFIWHADLDAIITRAVEVGLWTVTATVMTRGQTPHDLVRC